MGSSIRQQFALHIILIVINKAHRKLGTCHLDRRCRLSKKAQPAFGCPRSTTQGNRFEVGYFGGLWLLSGLYFPPGISWYFPKKQGVKLPPLQRFKLRIQLVTTQFWTSTSSTRCSDSASPRAVGPSRLCGYGWSGTVWKHLRIPGFLAPFLGMTIIVCDHTIRISFQQLI